MASHSDDKTYRSRTSRQRMSDMNDDRDRRRPEQAADRDWTDAEAQKDEQVMRPEPVRAARIDNRVERFMADPPGSRSRSREFIPKQEEPMRQEWVDDEGAGLDAKRYEKMSPERQNRQDSGTDRRSVGERIRDRLSGRDRAYDREYVVRKNDRSDRKTDRQNMRHEAETGYGDRMRRDEVTRDDTMLFGVRPVIEAIEAGRQLEKIFVKKGAEGILVNELRELCRARKLNLQEVPVEKLNRMTRGNHQGVVATISPIEYADLVEVLESIPEDEAPLIIVFDGVTDVRNFGAIARSAECAGAHALVVPMKNSAPVNADAVKTSAGALNLIPVCRVGSLRNTLKLLQQQGMQLVAATEKSNTLLFEADLATPTVIIMGSEDTGISKEILKMCDVQLAIPIVGTIASLNVSAAAAVMLFEAVRQRKMNQ